MIVPMKKATLLCLAHDRAAALDALRNLGVLHVKPVVPPAGAGLEDAREKAAGLRRLLDAIPEVEGAKPTGRDPVAVMSETSDLLDDRTERRDRLETLQAELGRTEPFGAFDPAAIQDLAAKGIVLKLYRASSKSPPPLPAGVTGHKLAVRKTDAYWALFSRADFAWPGGDEQRLPAAATAAMQAEAAQLRKDLDEDAGCRNPSATAPCCRRSWRMPRPK